MLLILKSLFLLKNILNGMLSFFCSIFFIQKHTN